MDNYTNNYGSNFPNSVMDQVDMVNADNASAAIINTFRGLVISGKYAEAQFYLESYPDIFQTMFIDAQKINRIFEEIRNAQIYALNTKQFLVETEYETEPVMINVGDVWLSGMEW